MRWPSVAFTRGSRDDPRDAPRDCLGQRAGRAAHATWVAEERSRLRVHRLAESRAGFVWAVCHHAAQGPRVEVGSGRIGPQTPAGPCAVCAEVFRHDGHEAAALIAIDARIAEEEAVALAKPPHVTIGEHWEVPHPNTGEVVQGLVMGGWPLRPVALAFHPLGPDRKSLPTQAFPIPRTDLIAKGRRWS